MSNTSGEVTADEVFDVLSDEQRRKLLVSLIADSPPDEHSLIAGSPPEEPSLVTDSSPDEPSLIADSSPDEHLLHLDPDQDVSLYHSHLPKLDKHGFIEWDQDTNVVRPGPNFEDARPLLELLAANRDRLPLDVV